MASLDVQVCAVLELLVMLFQVLGVGSLGVSRLAPRRWALRARTVYVLALLGLGAVGAILGLHDSEFALFAGGTMTALLVGMTVGGGAGGTTVPAATAGARLAA
jgi:uncharacterized membrane protein YcfT